MRARELTGRHVLFIFLAFFITVTGVNALMVTFAIGSFSGEDVKSAYVKGLNYNATLAARDAEARSGYSVSATAERNTGGVTAIRVAVTLEGAALPGDLAATAMLRHPANAHLDRSVALVRGADDRFSGEVDGLAPGQWDLAIILERASGTVFEASTRQWLR